MVTPIGVLIPIGRDALKILNKKMIQNNKIYYYHHNRYFSILCFSNTLNLLKFISCKGMTQTSRKKLVELIFFASLHRRVGFLFQVDFSIFKHRNVKILDCLYAFLECFIF